MKITIPKHTNLRTQSLFVLLAVAFVILLFSPRDHKFMYNFERGQVWQYELLIAPYDITILKPQEQLQAERDSVARNILPYCRMDKSVAKEKILLWSHDYASRWKKSSHPILRYSYGIIWRRLTTMGLSMMPYIKSFSNPKREKTRRCP